MMLFNDHCRNCSNIRYITVCLLFSFSFFLFIFFSKAKVWYNYAIQQSSKQPCIRVMLLTIDCSLIGKLVKIYAVRYKVWTWNWFTARKQDFNLTAGTLSSHYFITSWNVIGGCEKGFIEVQRLVLTSHSESAAAFLCRDWMFSLCLRGDFVVL